jgi:hypothetical protein
MPLDEQENVLQEYIDKFGRTKLKPRISWRIARKP